MHKLIERLRIQFKGMCLHDQNKQNPQMQEQEIKHKTQPRERVNTQKPTMKKR